MTVTGANAVAQTRSVADTSSNSASGVVAGKTLDMSDFLHLLVTQLENQDPLNPQDDKDFIAQMAQFSSLQGVQDLGRTADRLQGAALVGKNVNATVSASGVSMPISGVVSSVSFNGQDVTLMVGGQAVSLSNVTGISS